MAKARLFGTSKSARPTLAAAARVARLVRRAAEEQAKADGTAAEVIPPPAVMVIDAHDYEWITLGRELRAGNEATFTSLLTGLRQLVSERVERSAAVKDELEQVVRKATDKRRK